MVKSVTATQLNLLIEKVVQQTFTTFKQEGWNVRDVLRGDIARLIK